MNFSNKKNFSVDLTSGATIPGLEALQTLQKKKSDHMGESKKNKRKKKSL